MSASLIHSPYHGRQTIRIPLDLPAGLFGDDTSYAEEGRWGDGSNVRFRLGRPQVIGGWESLSSTLLTGVCRLAFPWTDNTAVLNIAFGTHEKLQLWQGGELFDITPLGPPTPLGTDPFTTTNTSAVVTVTQTAHGRTTGDSILIAGAVDTDGITAAHLTGTFAITVSDANTYHFTAGGSATSSGTGGGTAIIVTPQVVLPAGVVDGSGTIGYGTAGYGTGPWGTTPATAMYFPTTWSADAWGQELLASPRGGGMYLWSNDTSARAVAVAGAPVQITYCLVAPMDGGYMAFALGCNEESSGAFNPMCIRHSSVRDLTTWSTLASGSTSREYILTGGGRIVAGHMIGPYMLVWTSDALFLGTFVGALGQPWRFDRVGRNCGLLGPSAAVVVGQTAFWVSPDLQFYSYSLGGQPEPIPCPMLTEFQENLAASQGDKVVASSNAKFSEIRFDYPDTRDGYENSRYLALAVGGTDAGAWYKGLMARTAFCDANPALFPIGVTEDGHAYYHEKGNSADGQAFAWFIESADQLMDPDQRLLVKGLWPDFREQIGPITVTVISRETPQGAETSVSAAPMAPSDKQADLMITGRMFRARFAGNSSPTGCRLGKPIFEVEGAGRF